MKILKQGKVRENWSMHLECQNKECGALLAVEKHDLRYYSDSGYSNSRDPSVSFKCPCCGKETDLKRDVWPEDYKNLPLWYNR